MSSGVQSAVKVMFDLLAEGELPARYLVVWPPLFMHDEKLWFRRKSHTDSLYLPKSGCAWRLLLAQNCVHVGRSRRHVSVCVCVCCRYRYVGKSKRTIISYCCYHRRLAAGLYPSDNKAKRVLPFGERLQKMSFGSIQRLEPATSCHDKLSYGFHVQFVDVAVCTGALDHLLWFLFWRKPHSRASACACIHGANACSLRYRCRPYFVMRI